MKQFFFFEINLRALEMDIVEVTNKRTIFLFFLFIIEGPGSFQLLQLHFVTSTIGKCSENAGV
jgi:hypothetical protein